MFELKKTFPFLSSADHLDRVSTTPENFNLSPPLTSPPRTHSLVYTMKTVDHPMRKLKVFCLPVYLNIGWSSFTLTTISFFPSKIPYDRSVILDERSILITSLVYYFSVDHNLPSVDNHLPYSLCQFFFHYTLCMVDHTWPIHAFFQYSCYLFSIRYGQWTVDRNLPCPQRWTFFTKKLKHIQFVAQAYVRQAFQDFRFLLTSIYLRFPFEIGEKVPIFVEKLKKMKPPKMTFRSQIEPSIKSYECFMFFQNFRLEITLDWWILERQVRR